MNAMPPSAPKTVKSGRIMLVGAGPGDPDLLTLRAARAIMGARLIVHDGLVSPDILAMAPATARLICVAKRRGAHSMPQADINALIVAEALGGHDVVRLKGGDPFIFGRGGEELDAARAAGIAVEVVPGISAAIGAAAAAQLPLTHRDANASVVSFVTGQCKAGEDGPWAQNWAGLAGPGRTLVVYMGLANAAGIADRLIEDGLAPETRLAVVENATRPDMRVCYGVLAGLAKLMADEQVQSPAIIIIGAVTAPYAGANESNLRALGIKAGALEGKL